jgi:uroporphyrin-III C-methyltransferase
MPPEIHPILLVGAGPGAADLLTLRAARAIGQAQALLYDALVDGEVIAMASEACLRIRTGKRRGRASMSQDAINRLMLRLARRGLRVVRLKGGDPSIFGRVGEEVEFLARHGVASQVIPGVTAACAAAAQFGVPLTHRGEARRVILSTAMLNAGVAVGDWRAAADGEATLAIYMGAQEAAALSERLIAAGVPAATPAAAVERAGSPAAKIARGRVRDLAGMVAQLGEGPILLIVGEVSARGADVERSAAAA